MSQPKFKGPKTNGNPKKLNSSLSLFGLKIQDFLISAYSLIFVFCEGYFIIMINVFSEGYFIIVIIEFSKEKFSKRIIRIRLSWSDKIYVSFGHKQLSTFLSQI